MNRKAPYWAAAWLYAAGAVLAQNAPPATQSTPATTSESRVEKLEHRMDGMEKKHQEDLRIRDEEIARLRQQLDHKNAASQSVKDDVEKTTQDLLNDVQSNKPSIVTQRVPASFNPDFAVVTDYHANVSTNNDAPARNRFDVGEVELDLRAPVDPRADAVAIIPIDRGVTDPLFFTSKKALGADAGGISTDIDIEEAYLYLHDFRIPNLTAQLGRFHLRFGRQNILHQHDWPTADNAFVIRSFLGSESLVDQGLSLDYVIPPKVVGNQWFEVIAQVISGEGNSDDPVLNNDAFVDSPGVNLHALWNHDIASDWNLEVGTSFLYGKHNNDERQNAFISGGDFTLIHTDPTGRFNNQLFVGELIYGNINTSRTDTQHSLGAYLLAQQQLNHDFYLGCRFDWTKNAVNEKQEVWGMSPYLTWYWSEFLRWRLEYQHRGGDVKNEDTLYFQATWIFGAHPPHPYWAMR